MSPQDWLEARQMYIAGSSYKQIVKFFHGKCKLRAIETKANKEKWMANARKQWLETVKGEFHWDKKKEEYRKRVAVMIQNDLTVLEHEVIKNAKDLKRKYSSLKDLHEVAKDIFLLKDKDDKGDRFSVNLKLLGTLTGDDKEERVVEEEVKEVETELVEEAA